jgi:uncharacterized protein
VLQFFRRERLGVSFHAALPALGETSYADWTLRPEVFAQVLSEILEEVAASALPTGDAAVKIEPIDSICKSIYHGGGGSCTFTHCLGKFFAITPDGAIYPCQRFAGMNAFKLGNVLDNGGQPVIEDAPAWALLAQREDQIERACAGCDFISLCQGGCAYNALASGAGTFQNGYRDPYCKAYIRLFNEVIERAADEFFRPENLGQVIENLDPRKGLLRSGALLTRMSG